MAGLRIVFMGTAQLSSASLQALAQEPKFQLAAVVTQPDRPRGRDLKLIPSPVKELGLRLGIPVLQPDRARDEQFIQQIKAIGPDLIAVAAYGQILPKAILDIPPFGCLNVHTSLLPRYRGAAPIQWALLNDDSQTGVTIMKMNEGLDTGDILSQETTPIGNEDNGQTLHDRLSILGANLLVRTIPDYVSDRISPRPQPVDGVTHAPKIRKEDGRIIWSQPARQIWSRVRGLVPWPGAFTGLPDRAHLHLIKVWQAQVADRSGPPGTLLEAKKSGIVVGCGSQALRIELLQREGGRRLTAEQFLAGHALQPGEHFS